MPTLQDLKHEYRDLALKAHEIVADEKLSASEVREALDKIEGDSDKPEPGTLKALSAQIADAEYLAEKRGAYGSITNGDAPVEDNGPELSIGAQIVASGAFKAYRDQISAGGGVRHSGPIQIHNTALGTGDIGADVIAPQRQPGIVPIQFERLTVADLMPSGTTSGPVVRYVVETTATNAASTVAEKGEKPEAALDFDTVDEPTRKIAVIFKVADEMLEDFDQFASYVNGRLVLFVRIREEQQLLSGAGTGNDIDGLLNRSLTAAEPVGSETYGKIALAVHREITKVRVASFLDPDALVFHPNDWQAARFEADANGQFFGGGPFTGAYGQGSAAGDTYWGQRVVVTQAMTENTILLGAFRTAAQVFRRTGITVDMTNSDGTDFKNNITTVRAEERLALAVYRPSAFGTVTGA